MGLISLLAADAGSYSQGMDRSSIYRKLRERFKDEKPELLQEVAYNLALGSVTADLEIRAAGAIERLRARQHTSPLEAEAKKSQANFLSICPICKCGMRSVKLLEDRDAFYCPDHRIVVPFPIVQDSEADL